jgi:nicotinamidase/pyrazinamidase
MKKVLFMAVDCQKDFIDNKGKLYVQDSYQIKENLQKLTIFAEDNGIQVISTADWHNPNDPEISDKPDFKTTFPEHCVADSDGAAFISEVQPFQPLNVGTNPIDNPHMIVEIAKKDEIVIRKNKFDVFAGNPNTEEIIWHIAPDIVVVYGVAADVCVDFAVMGLLKKGYRVRVVVDAIKALPGADINALAKKWIDCGARFILADDKHFISCGENEYIRALGGIDYTVQPYYTLDNTIGE